MSVMFALGNHYFGSNQVLAGFAETNLGQWTDATGPNDLQYFGMGVGAGWNQRMAENHGEVMIRRARE